MSLLGKGAPLAPAISSEGLPAAHEALPDIPTLKLTEENATLLENSLEQATAPMQPQLDRRISVRSLPAGKPSADEDTQTDSDSTVCADPPRNMSFIGPVGENASESEGRLAQRPIKARRARPVPSIASESFTFIELGQSQSDGYLRSRSSIRGRVGRRWCSAATAATSSRGRWAYFDESVTI